MDTSSAAALPGGTSEDQPYPPARTGWWALTVFTIALILSYVDRQILSLLTGPVSAELQINDFQMSLLLGAAFAILYAVAGVPLGRVADLFPRRRVIVIGIVAWSAATLACGLAASFGQLFIARVCVGIGEAALLPAAVSILADYFSPSRRGTAIGILIMGAAAGHAIALVVGGMLLQSIAAGDFAWLPLVGGMEDWRIAFVLVALPGIPVALLVLTVPEPERRGGHVKPTMAVVRQSFRERRHLLIPIYISLGFMGIASMAFAAWIPALFLRRFDLSGAEIGASIGVWMLVGGFIGSVIAGMVGDALTKRWGLIGRMGASAGFSLFAIIGGLAMFAQTPDQLLLIACLMTIGTAGSMTVAAAGVQDIANSAIRGIAGSIISMMGTLVGMSAGPILVALLTQSVFGDPLALGQSISIVVAIAATASALLLFFTLRLIKQRPIIESQSTGMAAQPG